MGQRCQICNHTNRKAIEQAVLDGHPFTKIGNKYLVSWQAVRSHAQNHLSKRVVKAAEQKQLNEDINMVQKATSLMTDLEGMIDDFKKQGKDALTLNAIDKLIKLYQAMSSIASMYYQQQAETRFKEQEKEQDKEDEKQQEGAEQIWDTAEQIFDKLEKELFAAMLSKVFGEIQGMEVSDRSIKEIINDFKDVDNPKYPAKENDALETPESNQQNEETEQEIEQEPEPAPAPKKPKPYRKQIPSLKTDDPATKERVRRELGMSNSSGIIGRK